MVKSECHAWFQASAAMQVRSTLFFGFSAACLGSWQRSGTTYRSHPPRIKQWKKVCWLSWPLKMGPMCCPKTSVTTTDIRRIQSQKISEWCLMMLMALTHLWRFDIRFPSLWPWRRLSTGTWRRLAWQACIDVSEETAASVLTVELYWRRRQEIPLKVGTLLHHTTQNCSISTEVHFNKKYNTSDVRTPCNKRRCTGLSSLQQ